MHITDFKARLPLHEYGATSTVPHGMTPALIKSAYGLPKVGGKGTIALIEAFSDPTIEPDLDVFDTQFGLAACTVKNKCLEIHPMSSGAKGDSGWELETALDVEWSHAIAPTAKILVVEAKTDSGANLLAAIDYARKRSDVVAVSMSWGGQEFADETKLESHFASTTTGGSHVTFFASSGDDGAGVNWPAASPSVVGVGGTTLTLKAGGIFGSETAWQGSGGGVSQYEIQPAFQSDYNIPKADGMRAVPDVAFNADPATGYSVYHLAVAAKKPKTVSLNTVSMSVLTADLVKGWYVIGGTSAGAPQWAAIKALGGSASDQKFYIDKASAKSGQFFRDITAGSNGTCSYYCDARKHYDYVTGLGSPLTDAF
jgi:subtilase family serine protease